jgi:hypothetical protein
MGAVRKEPGLWLGIAFGDMPAEKRGFMIVASKLQCKHAEVLKTPRD